MDEARGCEHSYVHWYLDPCQEAGWRCLDCRAELGFRPDLERAQTARKVDAILEELHAHDFVYVSNASEGEVVVQEVTLAAHACDTYDQSSIARMILEQPEMRHGTFWWREQAHKWLAAQASGDRRAAQDKEQGKEGQDSGTD